MKKLVTLHVITIAIAAAIARTSAPLNAISAGVVISQVYGGGGNSGATLKNDFIELFNRGTVAVNVSGWSVQYAATAGTTWQRTNLPPVTVPPGGYLLVQEAAGAGGTTDLPAPDSTGNIAMSATSGKVALVNTTTVLAGSGCPFAATVVDFVGYGSTATCFEGAGPTVTLSNTTAALRAGNACSDTDGNSLDFTASAPVPHNSATNAAPCPVVTPTNPSGVGAASPASVLPGGSVLLTVRVTPGANPTSTGVAVSADLSAIGGAPSQAFFDDGSHGDLRPNDSVFSLTATVSASTAPGNKTLPASIADQQNRVATTTILLAVLAPPTPIHDIQSSFDTSPLAGQVVTTSGIVTGVKSNGFFIQSPENEYDGDPSTSEGIFVFTSSAPPAAASIGNLLLVTGRVQEFIPSADPSSPPATEIANASVSLLSASNALPAPVVLTAADTSGAPDQLERFEGMRVHVDSLTATAPTQGTVSEASATSTSNGVFYGVITGIARPFREAGIEIFDPLPPGAPLTVPRFDANPERLRVDSRALGGPILNVTTGAIVQNLTGPLDFGFRTYTIDVDAGSQASVSGLLTAPIPVRMPGPDEFTIATANFERFFDTANDPGTSDAVLTETAFNNRLNKASLEIRNVMLSPDIIGLEEIENASVLQAIADKVNKDAVANSDPNPNYQAYLTEGNDIGGIDSGFLVKSSRVAVVDVTQEGKDTTFVFTGPDGNPSESLLNDRPPLILRATLAPEASTSSVPVTVIVNHLRSLSGINDPADGDRVRHKRQTQAEFLANLIQARQAANPNERIVSVGDYNAFQINDGYVDSIGTIKGTPAPADFVTLASPDLVNPDLADLIDFAPADHRYSFVFDGNAQELDHILVTQNILPVATGIEYGRTNADFPEIFRDDANSPLRASDHDPVVSYFRFPTTTVSYNDTTAEAGSPATLPFILHRFDGTPVAGAPLSIDVGSSLFEAITDAQGVASVSLTRGVGTYDVTASYAGNPSEFLLGSTATGTFRAVDTTPPRIASVTPSRTSLWPPNKKMTSITISVAVADLADPNPACVVTGVTSNEDASGAWSLPGGLSVTLRADRNGNGPGRIYAIAVACTDASGNVANGTTGVVVPHDQR